ncbi:MAG: hypothetical protein A2Y76_02635 [Planctomycetes bacterium RBG_13_60_9]|nr:MAG: hypothetical protein A2Y76_02635 [Planctomycetes bacterium RBG_13_60_9]
MAEGNAWLGPVIRAASTDAEAKQKMLIGFNHAGGGLMFLGWKILILDRPCQYSQFADVPKTCANDARSALFPSSVRPTPVLQALCLAHYPLCHKDLQRVQSH